MSEESTPVAGGLHDTGESTPTGAPDAGRSDTLPNALDLHDAASGVQAVVHEFPATIGNALDCDLPLKGPGPSGVYAHLRRESDAFIIERAHSEVPLVISDKQLRSVILADGDRVTLGEHEIRVRFVHVNLSDIETPDRWARYRNLFDTLRNIDYAAKIALLKTRVEQLRQRFNTRGNHAGTSGNKQSNSHSVTAVKTPTPRRRLVLYAVAAVALAIILASFIKLISGSSRLPPDAAATATAGPGSRTASTQTAQPRSSSSAAADDRRVAHREASASDADRQSASSDRAPVTISRLSVPRDDGTDVGVATTRPEIISPQADDDDTGEPVTVTRARVAAIPAPRHEHHAPPHAAQAASRRGTSAGTHASEVSRDASKTASATTRSTSKTRRTPSTEQMLAQARQRYDEGDAPAALSLLERSHQTSPSSQPEELAQHIRQAFNAYSSGREAYQRHDFKNLLDARAQLISAEALMDTQTPSAYRATLDRLALPSLRQQATAAYEARNMALAYRLYTSVLNAAPNDSVARGRQRRIAARAKAYYIQGYRLEPKDLKSAMYYWQKAATLLPSGTRWHDQAVAKIDQYKTLMTQG